MSVVPRSEPLQSHSQKREKEAVHTLSFRSAKPAQRRENTWYQGLLHFCTLRKRAFAADEGNQAHPGFAIFT